MRSRRSRTLSRVEKTSRAQHCADLWLAVEASHALLEDVRSGGTWSQQWSVDELADLFDQLAAMYVDETLGFANRNDKSS